MSEQLSDLAYLQAQLRNAQLATATQKASMERFKAAIYTLSTQEVTQEAWRVFTSELWAVVVGIVKPSGENLTEALWIQEGKRQLALQILLGAKE